jgi:glycine/D-amino acid oxidase-like deaminating enzyme
MGLPSIDVVIVGGGIMGSSTAYHLTKADPSLKVVVVEKDPSYTYASSALSATNIRVQFSLQENIQASQYTIEVLKNFETEMAVDGEKPSIDYHGEGNLFPVEEKNVDIAKNSLQLQKSLNCDVEWWSPERIRDTYPLFEIGNYAGGTFGAKDGRLDAYSLLMAYKTKARSQGAVYLKEEVVEVITDNKRATGVRLSSGDALKAGTVINCAGPWAALLAETVGVKLPVEPTKRQIFVMTPAAKLDGPLPLTILPSGLYFRTEPGGMILLGKSLPEDPVGFDFSWDDKRYYDQLWPELAEFVPSFDTAKLNRGWAGLYAVNTLDDNAILGEWPELKRFFLANGFSGHGMQHGPAVGRYLSELVLGKKPQLDLSKLGPERILENRPLYEDGIV